MTNPWKTYLSKHIYTNPWITLSEHDVTSPEGGKSLYGKVHYKNLALGIIPLDEKKHMAGWPVLGIPLMNIPDKFR